MMNKRLSSTIGLIAVIGLLASPNAIGAGGKNAYNNPTGSPAEDTFQMPYMNIGDGRVLVQCAEDEEMLLTPTNDGGVEIVCAPAAD
jgi:hypothetical protein